MAAPRLVISSIHFDIGQIATALKLNEHDIVTALRDGRGAWPFSELWGEKLYEFIKHGNSNQPFSDGAVALEQLRDVNVSIKALTSNGIKFQQSKFVGSGRGTNIDGLIMSIEACDRIIVVDVTEFPIVKFVPIDATRLLSAAHKGLLTTNGWKKPRFYQWLDATYEVANIALNI